MHLKWVCLAPLPFSVELYALQMVKLLIYQKYGFKKMHFKHFTMTPLNPLLRSRSCGTTLASLLWLTLSFEFCDQKMGHKWMDQCSYSGRPPSFKWCIVLSTISVPINYFPITAPAWRADARQALSCISPLRKPSSLSPKEEVGFLEEKGRM